MHSVHLDYTTIYDKQCCHQNGTIRGGRGKTKLLIFKHCELHERKQVLQCIFMILRTKISQILKHQYFILDWFMTCHSGANQPARSVICSIPKFHIICQHKTCMWKYLTFINYQKNAVLSFETNPPFFFNTHIFSFISKHLQFKMQIHIFSAIKKRFHLFSQACTHIQTHIISLALTQWLRSN